MKVSLNWVKEFTEVDLPASELITLATERLGGIEDHDDLGKHYDGIVVAKVVSCIKHPNADKLSLCKVDDGGVVKDVARDENGYVQVVCGAPNVREGLLVAWIPPGAVVPNSYGEKELFVLEARDLRGQLSNGMLASPRELGINEEHDGILEINESEAKAGQPFKELYKLDDVIVTIENKMFTHRPDCFGILGVAREIAGIQHKAFKSPDWYLKEFSDQTSEDSNLKVVNEIPELAPRYTAVVIDGIKVGPSPIWLQSYLKRLGIRPINNIVDITNYAMMLTAQPLHAFDFDKIAKDNVAEITIRKPRKGEKMTLLDGKEIEPHSEAILICNPDGPIALGGVMGGGNSEVDSNTTKIVLECATFDMYSVRKTSMEHGVFTEAVTRLNKGQPGAQLPAVIHKTIELFEQLAGASKASDIVDSNPESNQHLEIEIEKEFINDRLGSKFTNEEIIKLLENVEFKAHEASGPIAVRPPFWRTDIEIKEDIVEEIGRLSGFNQLPATLPKRSIEPVTPDSLRELKDQVRQILARSGANEVLSYTFVHGNLLRKAGQNPEDSFALRNALSPDLQHYRLSLTPSLLDLVHPNIKAGIDRFALFEIGKTHYKGEMDASEPDVPNEDNHVALVLAYGDKSRPDGAPYFAARRYLAELAPNLASELVPMSEFDMASDEWGQQLTAPYEPNHTALIIKDDQIWGVVGEFKQEVRKVFKLPEFTSGIELHVGILQAKEIQYTALSKFPSSEQDLTLQVEQKISFAQLEKLLKSELGKTGLQWRLEPLSIFSKDQTEKKNISFRVTLTANDHTLTTEEVSRVIENLSWQAHEVFEAQQI